VILSKARFAGIYCNLIKGIYASCTHACNCVLSYHIIYRDFIIDTEDVPVRVYFGVDAKPKAANAKTRADPSKRVVKEDIPTLESQLLAAEEILSDISNEIEFARKQEIVLKEAADVTASRIEWFSIFSIVILFVTSVWQILYLRYFFSSKKLI
jgi:emp24/gp25L/p24 family/GOLD